MYILGEHKNFLCVSPSRGAHVWPPSKSTGDAVNGDGDETL